MSESGENRAESIRQRLRNLLRERRENVQFGLERYAIERFLYRLGISKHRERFILKGATLFALWGGPIYRPTRDLDFTGYGSAEEENVLAALRDICLTSSAEDQLVFDPDTVTAEPIRDDSEYHGLRIRLDASLATSRIPIRIDIGFGNAIEPPPQDAEYPTLLDDPPPHIRAYLPEAVVAEKLHAMVVLGERNSRYKDFYDLHVLAHQFRFDGEHLSRAIAATFKRRLTKIDAALPTALTPRFFADEARAGQWRAYLTRNNLPGAPGNLGDVGESLMHFLNPVWSALAENVAFTSGWAPGGMWNSENRQNEISTASLTRSSQTNRIERQSDDAETLSLEDIETEIKTPLRRFKPYSAYKDSGVKWLGKIPTHWDMKKVAWVTECLDGRRIPLNGDERGQRRGEYPYWGANSVVDYVDRWIFDEELVLLGEDGAPFFDRTKPVAFHVSGKIWVNNHAHVLRPKPWMDAAFLSHVLNSVDYRMFIDGSTRDKLTQSDMNSIPIQAPELPEQCSIAAFLDRETAKIDALLAKKERLIELLQEKRTALITRAVTRGLEPNVPMKDSGVEWLGEIPTHWESAKMWQISTATSGGTPTKENLSYWGGDIPWVSPKDMKRRFINSSEDTVTEHALAESGIKLIGPPVVLIVVRGMILAHSFPVAVTTAPVTINQDMKAVRFIPEVDPLFMAWVLEGIGEQLVAAVVEEAAHGTRAIRMDQWRTVTVAVPPKNEQLGISAFLDLETAKIDTLIARIRSAINRLTELRAALIAAAVTGKIDVREEAA